MSRPKAQVQGQGRYPEAYREHEAADRGYRSEQGCEQDYARADLHDGSRTKRAGILCQLCAPVGLANS